MKSSLLPCVSAICIATFVAATFTAFASPRQSTANHPATVSDIPEWQIAAGGSAKFDVASVKQSGSNGQYYSNVPLNAWNSFARTGGLFSATNIAVVDYLTFAYKLSIYESHHILPSQLPKWAKANHYDIQARASGNPTKDQYRLMMQALLADRFKLRIHRETRQLPVFALVLERPGQLGPKLRPHVDNPPCAATGIFENFDSTRFNDGFPARCGAISGEFVRGRDHIAARNVAMAALADMLSDGWEDPGRPIVDETGLTGNFDFSIEYSPQFTYAPSQGAQAQIDPAGPTYPEALKEQLGLKLESETASADILVIDRIEEPSPN